MTETLRHISWKIWLAGIALLAACSDDGNHDSQRQRITFEAQPYSTYFAEQDANTRTRAWTPPAGFAAFNASLFAQQENLVNRAIEVFLTRDEAFTDDGNNYQQGTFFYNASAEAWRLSMEIKQSGDYYVYGFMPQEEVASATITPNSTFSKGAVLTLHGVKAVTPSDICVIVGAKEGDSEDNDNELRQGQFTVKAQPTGSENTHNYIFLLFDHLYSAIRFSFTIDEYYAELRTIKLRRLELIANQNDGGTPVKAKYDITIKLKSNDEGATPIVDDVTFTPDEASADIQLEPIFEGEVTLSPTTPTSLTGCFVPSGIRHFKLRTTYDVYDRKDNPIRKGCTAENDFDLSNIFGVSAPLERGYRNTLNIKVKPTFLYVLSEPDLDNQAFSIE